MYFVSAELSPTATAESEHMSYAAFTVCHKKLKWLRRILLADKETKSGNIGYFNFLKSYVITFFLVLKEHLLWALEPLCAGENVDVRCEGEIIRRRYKS